nr:hypothetical protein [Tanacetum cinerariifolium]
MDSKCSKATCQEKFTVVDTSCVTLIRDTRDMDSKCSKATCQEKFTVVDTSCVTLIREICVTKCACERLAAERAKEQRQAMAKAETLKKTKRII